MQIKSHVYIYKSWIAVVRLKGKAKATRHRTQKKTQPQQTLRERREKKTEQAHTVGSLSTSNQQPATEQITLTVFRKRVWWFCDLALYYVCYGPKTNSYRLIVWELKKRVIIVFLEFVQSVLGFNLFLFVSMVETTQQHKGIWTSSCVCVCVFIFYSILSSFISLSRSLFFYLPLHRLAGYHLHIQPIVQLSWNVVLYMTPLHISLLETS